jgi:predicted DNA-binding transcriptional regulator YafY
MHRSTGPDAPAGIAVHRAARLYRLVTLVGDRAKPRDWLLKKLRIDVRSFYRDLEFLRGLDVEITTVNGSYVLSSGLDDALGKIPFPDPGFSVRDALHLMSGSTAAKKKLKKAIDAVVGIG